MESILDRMQMARGIVAKTFGVRVLPFFAGWVWLNFRIANAIGLALDGIFFRKLGTVQIKAPIVLVGNPRTGTTFLQRFLADQGYGAGMEVFRMLHPSLLVQTVIKPFLPILEMVSPAKYHSTKAHDTNLTSVETDDVGVLFRYFDGFFLYGFFLAFHETDLEDQFKPEVRDTSERDFAWLETLWKRSLVAHGSDTVIAKLFSLGTRLPQFLKKFPDAKILYMARDPVATIPSGMSLVTGVLENAFGFWKLPEDVRARWMKRLYTGLVELQRRFAEDYVSGRIPNGSVYVVRYDRMMSEFEVVMDEMHAFLGVKGTDPQLKAIADQADKQRSYKSEHAYDLAKFGLDEATIRRDCASYYDTFLPPLAKAPPAEASPVAREVKA
jgi:omega-hydroxy-beta-dihydromenaquinone-9 sulfotransferase